jgi:hypothetical protein
MISIRSLLSAVLASALFSAAPLGAAAQARLAPAVPGLGEAIAPSAGGIEAASAPLDSFYDGSPSLGASPLALSSEGNLAAPIPPVAQPAQARRASTIRRKPSFRAMLAAGSWIFLLGACVGADTPLQPAFPDPASFVPPSSEPDGLAPLESLMHFHPSWVTRSVTSHDPWGGNDDGNGKGMAEEDGYRTLFHGEGEGRVLRIWMTAQNEELPRDYKEIWIQLDGKTVFRGKPLDFFEGRGPWKAPLVMGQAASSGGFLSYAPFPYKREAKILFKGNPHYFQVTYRQGAGSSAGPSAEQLQALLTEAWWDKSPKAETEATVDRDEPLVLAQGPATVEGLSVRVRPERAPSLRLRIGSQKPVPLASFFGGWTQARSALNNVDTEAGLLQTRLPIPLQAGESLSIESDAESADGVEYGVDSKPSVPPGVRLEAQYREQNGPGTPTTMPFFETSEPSQFVSLSEQISDGKPGSRQYLEGDEMVRTDGLRYPFQLGTGTEDYFNGGWYFWGAHANPLSGQPGFVVKEPEDGWSHAHFEHSLYRHHLLDPVVGRSGIRFGFEAGDEGAFTPVTYRTLGLGYVFSGPKLVGRQAARLDGLNTEVESAVDAEREQKPQRMRVRYLRGHSYMSFACPKGADGLLLTRTYDAAAGDQGAYVLAGGRRVGRLYEAYSNSHRRIAQDSIWIDLSPADRKRGFINVDIDSTLSKSPWSEAGYEAVFFSN